MRKPDPVEQALDRLGALKNEPASPEGLARELNVFLNNRSNLVVAKAARLASSARITDLIPGLVAAFHRLMANAAKLDKGCAATTELVTALHEMDYAEPEVYLAGIHHVQMEGAYGPPVDVGAKLRAVSALGLARTRYPDALDEIVLLLVDFWPQARIGAVRALACNGGFAGALLLKLKILTGESEPEVVAECFSGLLENAQEESVPFIAGYIDSEDLATAEAALLALGTSRLPEAFEILKARWESGITGPLRKVLLLALAMIRSQSAIDFLLSLLEACPPQTARDMMPALALFRDNERVRERAEAIVTERKDATLAEAFRREF